MIVVMMVVVMIVFYDDNDGDDFNGYDGDVDGDHWGFELKVLSN